ncbi:hypothetical protein ACFU75_19445 [Heyndrickxia sporothermodurans]
MPEPAGSGNLKVGKVKRSARIRWIRELDSRKGEAKCPNRLEAGT